MLCGTVLVFLNGTKYGSFRFLAATRGFWRFKTVVPILLAEIFEKDFQTAHPRTSHNKHPPSKHPAPRTPDSYYTTRFEESEELEVRKG